MKITISVKQLGKRRPTIAPQVLDLPGLNSPCTLEVMIDALVGHQVEAFRLRLSEPILISFLTDREISEQLIQGKISFGEKYNSSVPKLEHAQEAARLAFKDGLYKVFQNQDEITSLDQVVNIKTTDVFTFIRLTFLTGN